MAIVTNTFTTFDAKGIREDLSNVITNIAPEETPFMSNIGRETISNSLYEWQTDTLAAAAANKQLEGDDVTSFDAVTATVRMQNYAQISRKTIVLSATEETVNKAGRRSELLQLIEDQTQNGIILTRTRQHIEKDQITGVDKTVTVVEVEKDEKTQSLRRATESPLKEFGLTTYNLTINQIKYEDRKSTRLNSSHT